MTTPPGTGPDPIGGPPTPVAGHGAGTPGDEPPTLETERIPAADAAARRPRLAAVPLAWSVAVVADLVQWVLWPVFLAGAASPIDDVIDVVVAGILLKLLGWHWAFAPSFIVKLIPVADFVPTWTMAVWIATRGRKKP